ncbi:MAG: septum formation inhibitor Maf [Clostridia bacterium]|nr:septum formation inhibitor Maf [Clostridia bacterium]
MILASASPRRKELLTSMGVPFEIITADTEEAALGDPRAVVMQNARLKAAAVHKDHPSRMILGADTVVSIDGQVLGKPRDEEDAFRMLRSLSGRQHKVYTGVCLIFNGKADVRCDETDVYFAPLSDDEIRRYIATGEPMDKAGAYAIQGIAGMYVEKINGSFSNVIGLPTALVRAMLQAAQA